MLILYSQEKMLCQPLTYGKINNASLLPPTVQKKAKTFHTQALLS